MKCRTFLNGASVLAVEPAMVAVLESIAPAGRTIFLVRIRHDTLAAKRGPVRMAMEHRSAVPSNSIDRIVVRRIDSGAPEK